MTSIIQINQNINLNITRKPNSYSLISINNENFRSKLKIQNNYFVYVNMHHEDHCFPTKKVNTSCGQYHIYLTNAKEDKLIPLDNKYYIHYDNKNHNGIHTLKKVNSNLNFEFVQVLSTSKIKPEDDKRGIIVTDEQIQKLFDQY